MRKSVGIGIAIFVMGIVVFGLFVYSYTQLSVSLNDVRFHSIDWAEITWPTLIKLGLDTLAGDWFGTAFELIQSINLNLIFGLSNKGILPIYIPDLSYEILINDISIGEGYSDVNITINPGDTKEITSFQNIQKDIMAPAALSISDSKGVLEIRVKGMAIIKMLGVDIPVSFESSRQISIYDEVRDRINEEIQKNKQHNIVRSSVGKSLESAIGSIVNDLFGTDDLDLSLDGEKFIDSIYKVGPGTYTYVSFSLPCTTQVQGGFIANAALGDDIIVYLFDDGNFDRFRDDQSADAYYDSGKVKSGEFDLVLSAGEYYIVMSNQYSTFSTKNVQLQVSSLCM